MHDIVRKAVEMENDPAVKYVEKSIVRYCIPTLEISYTI